MNSPISSFKNKFKGKRCVIFGTGPSLTLNLINEINNAANKIFSFTANGFCVVFNDIEFRPNAVCMSNYFAVEHYLKHYPDSTLKFLRSGWEGVVPYKPKNVYSLPFECNHSEDSCHIAPFIKDGNFTTDPGIINYCGDTVLLDFCFPLAYYMGFSEIYLIGVDCDYSKGYFHKDCMKTWAPEGYKGMSTGDYSIILPSYRYTYEYFKSMGRSVYKITESKYLDFIPTKKLDVFLKDVNG